MQVAVPIVAKRNPSNKVVLFVAYFVFLVQLSRGLAHCTVEDATTEPWHYPKAEGLPGMQITNWKDMILTWVATTNCRGGPIARVAGPNTWRISDDWTQTLINFDTFAVRWGTKPNQYDQSCTDPKLWQGSDSVGRAGMVCTVGGEFLATYDTYDQELLPFHISTSFVLPINERFYIKKITVKNTNSSTLYMKVLSLIENGLKQSDFGFLSCPVEARQDKGIIQCLSEDIATYAIVGERFFHINMEKCGSFHIGGGEFEESGNYCSCENQILESDVFEEEFRTSTQVGPSTGKDSALSVFRYQSDGNGVASVTEDVHVQAASIFLLELKPNEMKTIYSFRAASSDEKNLFQVMKRASERRAEQWIASTAVSYEEWLNSGVQPEICLEDKNKFFSGRSCLNSNASELFKKSLILSKNSQNPTLGIFASSFHTLYGWKAWMRDCCLLAIIMGEAGHLEEERKFLEWASFAELRSEWSGGGFHSTYSAWNGDVHDFVEPQYDATALFLVALSHYSLKTNDFSLWEIRNGNSRPAVVEQMLLRRDYEQLWAPDFSIWEESSDPVTGERLPRKYYAFTQAAAYGALVSAAKCRRKQKMFDRAEQLEQRAKELQNGIERIFWNEEHGHYLRSIEDGSRGWLPNPYAPDSRIDSSSIALLLFDVVTNETRRIRQLEQIQLRLTRRGWGIARYGDDHYFYDGIFSPCGCEARNMSPPWGVTTMFTAISEWMHREKHPNFKDNVFKRLQWMVDHSAYGMMPVGEANDGVTGLFVSASTPDIYEYAGVYVWTILLSQEKACPLSPFQWNND
eukprot:jgi/Galph1/729/GphlegSOOS_G5574.1